MMNAYKESKQALFEVGQKTATEFLKQNGLAPPRFLARSLLTDRKPQGWYGCGAYLPRARTVIVNPEACATPSQGYARQWSFPGYIVDRTPVGVVAHETGHYVDHVLGYPSNSEQWRKLAKTQPISSYEPNPSESFAETMRVFILNPSFLKQFAPNRHGFVIGTLRLMPRPSAASLPITQLEEWGASSEILRVAANKRRVTKL